MVKTLLTKIPEKARQPVAALLEKYPVQLIIVAERRSKHGDFKRTAKGQYQITLNNNLNPYQLLLTLIHEMAHLLSYLQYRNIKPHGREWKQQFQELMLPFLCPEIFPESLLPPLASYLKNPKASTGSDVVLTRALLCYNNTPEATYLFEIAEGTLFHYQKKTYQKGRKRRTRFECLELSSKRLYLFNQNAQVTLIQ